MTTLNKIYSNTETYTVTTNHYSIGDIDPKLLYVKQVVNNKFCSTEFVNKNKGILKKCNPVFLNSDGIKFLSINNPFQDYRMFNKFRIESDDIIQGKVSVTMDNLYWLYNSGHLVFDNEQNPVPIVHYFDYIRSPFSSRRCNMVELLNYLKQHPWVVNGNELKIEPIPHYNNHSGFDTMFTPCVKIKPDKESYIKMWESLSDKDSVEFNNLISGSNILCVKSDKDWLGIRPYLVDQS